MMYWKGVRGGEESILEVVVVEEVRREKGRLVLSGEDGD